MLNITILHLVQSSCLSPMMFSGASNFKISQVRISKSLGHLLFNPASFKVEKSVFMNFQKAVVELNSDNQCVQRDNGITDCKFINISQKDSLLAISQDQGDFNLKNILVTNCRSENSLFDFNIPSFRANSICIINSLLKLIIKNTPS